MKNIILSALFLAFNLLIHAQQTIKGKITDSKGEAIEFATIHIPGTSKGTVSNIEGNFEFYIENSEHDSLTFSHIGFFKKTVSISSISKSSSFMIQLKENVISLGELVVRPIEFIKSPNEIVKQAIARINETSNPKPILYKGFYRHVDEQDGEYKRLLESSLVIKEDGFPSNKTSFHIDHLRRSYDFRNIYRNDVKLNKEELDKRDSLYRTLNLDCWYINNFRRYEENNSKNAINRCSSYDFGVLDSYFVPQHSFKLDTIIYENNDPFYVIKILPSSKSKSYYSMPDNLIVPVGKLYIRASDFAILRMDYHYILNPKKSKTQDYYIFSKVMGSRIMFSINAIYKEYNDKIYLSYLKTQHYTSISKDDREIRSKYTGRVYNLLTREFLVNEIITDSMQVQSYTDDLKWNLQIDLSANKFDPEFWGKYNTTVETGTQRKLRENLERKFKYSNENK